MSAPVKVLAPDAVCDRPPKARELFSSAVEAFAARGYHATTTRDIASRVGLSTAGMYVHYGSKEDLLFEICRFGHGRVLELMLQASKIKDPAERIAAMARDSAVFHAEHHTLARVNQNEFRALSPERRDEIVAMRRQITALHLKAVRAGVRQGSFQVDDVHGTSLALLTLCHDVARWFPTRELRDAERVGRLYGELALRMVGAERG